MVATTNAGPAPTVLQGQWAGDRLQLVVDPQGGRVESDCASGRFGSSGSPVMVSSDGTFNAQGSFENHQPGPQRAAAAAPAAAQFSGKLHGSMLTLTITPADPSDPSAALVFSLQRDARIKLLRCL